MPDGTPQADPNLDQLNAMAAEFRREKAAVEDQRREMAILIKQALAEAERAAQRDREIAVQRHQMEADLESFPRAEIKRRYTESQESQARLATWRSQLEQLRNRQTTIEKNEELLNRILKTIDWMQKLQAESAVPQLPPQGSPGAQGAMAGAALQAIELAHHRLSRQLQDMASQALSDLILRAEVAERLIGLDQQKAREELSGLRLAAASALKATRQLVHDLVPPALEDLGVVAALERYVEVSRCSERLRIDLHVDGQERRLPQSHEIALFRVVQEAVANAALHSGADEAEVRLRFEPGQVIATVVDRGRGFEVGPALARARLKDHSGLIDMHSRADMVDGVLEISSKPGAGCMVSLVLTT